MPSQSFQNSQTLGQFFYPLYIYINSILTFFPKPKTSSWSKSGYCATTVVAWALPQAVTSTYVPNAAGVVCVSSSNRSSRACSSNRRLQVTCNKCDGRGRIIMRECPACSSQKVLDHAAQFTLEWGWRGQESRLGIGWRRHSCAEPCREGWVEMQGE
jgi:hypothetical protein